MADTRRSCAKKKRVKPQYGTTRLSISTKELNAPLILLSKAVSGYQTSPPRVLGNGSFDEGQYVNGCPRIRDRHFSRHPADYSYARNAKEQHVIVPMHLQVNLSLDSNNYRFVLGAWGR
jgi:hypothetical protein